VYIIENEHGMVKIGVSKQPIKRIQILQNQSGLKIVNSYISEPTTKYRDIEKYLHQQFSIYRKKGEWFFQTDMYEKAANKLRLISIQDF
jgi:hypothetical protein